MALEPGIPLEERFTYHPPKGDQWQRYVSIRLRAMDLAFFLQDVCPASRERTLAIGKLEEAVMWSNSSIARNE